MKINVYKSGQEFLKENGDILAKNPLETVFFELNAKYLSKTNKNDFILKMECGDKYLIAVHVGDYPMDIFGDKSLCVDFANFAAEQKLTFTKVLGSLDTCEAFLAEYDRLTGCTHAINHAMDIMRCSKPDACDTDGVEWATERDTDELASLTYLFNLDAMGESGSIEDCKQKVSGNINNHVLIRKEGKIVSFASKSRETEFLAAISGVYTLPQYRNQGLSCKIVTFLTKNVTDSGRLAYLFVDKTNPVSNHLYSKIGYTYATPQYEFVLKKRS